MKGTYEDESKYNYHISPGQLWKDVDNLAYGLENLYYLVVGLSTNNTEEWECIFFYKNPSMPNKIPFGAGEKFKVNQDIIKRMKYIGNIVDLLEK